MSKRNALLKWILRCRDALRRHWVRMVAICTLVFTLSTLLFVVSEPAHARDLGPGVKVENTYALEISTGVAAGDQVEFFAVTYLDQSGIERTEHLFVNKGKFYPGIGELTYAKFKEQLKDADFFQKRQASVAANTGYTLTSASSGGRCLQPNTIDMILFQPQHPLKVVTGIDFFGTSGEKGMGQWSCRTIRLYQVDTLYGFSSAGYLSTQRMTEFKGALLGEVQISDPRTLDWSTDRWFYSRASASEGRPNDFPFKNYDEGVAVDTTKQQEYFFEIAFDDTYGAGIESLINNDSNSTLIGMDLYAALALEVIYTDVYGTSRKVSMPVIQNSVNWALENGAKATDVVNGIAQQGESIGFAGLLPDCQTINSYRIAYGYKNASKEAGVLPIAPSALHNQRVAQQTSQSNPDSILVSYVAVYDMNKAQVSAKVEDGCLQLVKTGDPILCNPRARDQISPGNAVDRNFVEYTGQKLDFSDYANAYLVTVKTDDMPSAGTRAGINMRFQYSDSNGAANSSETYELKQAHRDYYGQQQLVTTDAPYAYLLSPKQEIKFIIKLNDVARFTNVDITLDDSVNDDWQMKELSIEKLGTLGKRNIAMTSWSITDYANKTLTGDRLVSRTNTTIPIASVTNPVMLQPDQTVTVSMEGNVVVPGEDVEDEWLGDRYEMSFEQASQNLGLAKIRSTYLVTVDVADDLVTSTSNGDCGSRNHFYFQLLFEKGTSAYVLANQQLSADGFRAGVQEQFAISVNQNYGALVGVNIIPDTTTSESQAYDKLKINTIAVSRAGSGGVSKQWILNDVGWVAIDYKEEGEAQKTGVSDARAEGELVRSFLVSYSSYVVNLEFCITTGAYNMVQGTNAEDPQFEGAITAKIVYLNGKGEYRSQDVDIVNAMYSYAGKAPLTAGENGVIIKDRPISDRSYMFRGGKADRFVVGLDDVSQLLSIEFYATGTISTNWNIKGVSASIIQGDGPLLLNTENEYQRKHTTEEVAVCKSGQQSDSLAIFANQTSIHKMLFEDNAITVKETDDKEWETTITRVPASPNNLINVFLMPKGDGLTNKNYSVDCALRYTNAYGAIYESARQTLRRSGNSPYFSINGITATNMAELKSMALYVNSSQTLDNFLDYAVIQQIRAGVVVDTYIIKISSSSSKLTQSYPVSSKSFLPPQAQVVELKLGQDMGDIFLSKEGRDAAIAIQYTNELLPATTVLSSPYIFLTDQQCQALAAGNTVRIVFDQSFVKDIKGLKVTASGGVDFPVALATAGVYTVEGGVPRTCTSRTNFTQPFRVNIAGATVTGSQNMTGDGVLQTLELTFADAAGKRTETSIPKNPVRMVVSYMNTADQITEVTFDDLRLHQATRYLADKTENPLKVSVMLPGVKKIRTIRFEPYDSDSGNLATWDAPWVYLRLSGPTGTTQLDFAINKLVSEGEQAYLNVANLALTVSGETYNADTDTYTSVSASTKTPTETSLSLQTPSGKSVRLLATADNSANAFSTKVERVDAAGNGSALVNGLIQSDGESVSFNTPTNNTGASTHYRVTVALKDLPHLSVVVNITILPEPAKQPEPTPAPPKETDATGNPGKDPPKADETPSPPPDVPPDTGGAGGTTSTA